MTIPLSELESGDSINIRSSRSIRLLLNSGEYAIVKINNRNYKVGDEGGSFVWDKDGNNEYVFSTVGEIIYRYNGKQEFSVTYTGTGSQNFTINFIRSDIDFHFTTTADQRSNYSEFEAVCDAIKDNVGGPGAFHVGVGDEDETDENRLLIDASFGDDYM